MTTTLYVPHPERWWIAARADLPWLTDPDVEPSSPSSPTTTAGDPTLRPKGRVGL